MANIYEVAQRAYDQSIKALRGMTKLIELAVDDYDGRVTLNQFDILLQYSLLQVALADGYLNVHECLFIKELTRYSDFCVFLNQRGFHDVTWLTIYNTNEEFLRELLMAAEDAIIELSKDFIFVFSLIDSVTEYDYVSDLKRNIILMIMATCQSDGHAESDELGNGCLIVDVVNVVEDIIRKTERRLRK